MSKWRDYRVGGLAPGKAIPLGDKDQIKLKWAKGGRDKMNSLPVKEKTK
ncbi:MAG TPA: hypothetical protein PKW06_15135 [Cyclobacteriaceae bacterium]|nr:hypothetical protein [Cyclobacteriaceae bacterium]MCB9238607.1 hypothetical protein [Flammeovirgaceae bacterium]MCB0499799.1 hypothetical protein [Cyclobacteriaceae bacterium]MCO5271779.1 hypothetical protein [Cyclobacteriaceae bacterium]MCW5902344.1 hypothetical protein [Cyclobacteriaceae bacterium]